MEIGSRPQVKFVTAVWGEAYIARFAGLSLPSILAPGNLPALAQAAELEVVILTRRLDQIYFERQPAFRHLCTLCNVRFIDIEDLITTAVYGVTLTLAYARAIIETGDEMLNTHFVFMNADFVLADGSLKSLARQILSGRAIVLAPSFRATAENVEPALARMVSADSPILSVPTRDLVALSLPHPHPTTVAKLRNQKLWHSTHPNQLFWQVDENTILARYYLIFMLCLKPERVIRTINCFCDYSFVPELCPSGDEVVMGDSDEFFMLELQRRDQELEMLRVGQQSDRALARSLSQWTTREHRRAAKHDVIFHSKGLPAGLGRAKEEAQRFVSHVEKMLGPPIPHAGHRYWLHGVEAWRTTAGPKGSQRRRRSWPLQN